jgi:cob(I)alamin adenosyltransferase
MQGFVHVYTGEGKGKTTAALGLALRAAGAGRRVFIAQFCKGGQSSEHVSMERLADRITIRGFGSPDFIMSDPSAADITAARDGLAVARDIISGGEHGLVILDEASVAVRLGLFTVDELLSVLDARPPHVELVITGRDADPRLVARADLVTEMRNITHYFDRGVQAREGIEY